MVNGLWLNKRIAKKTLQYMNTLFYNHNSIRNQGKCLLYLVTPRLLSNKLCVDEDFLTTCTVV